MLTVFRTVDSCGYTTRIVQIDYFTGKGTYYYVTSSGVVSFDGPVAVNGDGDIGAHMIRWITNGDTIMQGWC